MHGQTGVSNTFLPDYFVFKADVERVRRKDKLGNTHIVLRAAVISK